MYSTYNCFVFSLTVHPIQKYLSALNNPQKVGNPYKYEITKSIHPMQEPGATQKRGSLIEVDVRKKRVVQVQL